MDPQLVKSTHHFTYGAHTLEGDHHPNEDRYKVKSNFFEDSEGQNVFYAGIFDGHGGSLCSEYCQRNMHRNLLRELKRVGNLTDKGMSIAGYYQNNLRGTSADHFDMRKRSEEGCLCCIHALRDEMIVASLLNAFAKTEEEFLRVSVEAKEFSGACANVLLVYRDTIYVANLGDCRCVLGRSKGKAIGLSRDHKASVEKSRIRKVGGFVKHGRVNGVLAISRTIGDREFKDPISMSARNGTTDRSRSPSRGSSSSGGPGPAPPGILARSATSTGIKHPGNGNGNSSNSLASGPNAPMLRRVSSPNSIVLKNVRDSADSSPKTRRPDTSPKSRRLAPSSAPNTANIKGSSSPPATSPSSTNEDIPSPTLLSASTTESTTPASSPASSSELPPRETRSNKPSKRKGRHSSTSGSGTTTPNTESSSTSLERPDSARDLSHSSSAESHTPEKPASLKKDASAPEKLTVPTTADNESDDSSTPDDNQPELDDADDASVDGMYDVIECYDAETKQRKFGFSKRRPPKDPKHDIATIVSAIPEITIMRRTTEDQWIFLASDGFYDFFTSKQTGTAVNKHLARSGQHQLDNAAKSLCDESASLGSEDDITGILVLLQPPVATEHSDDSE